jgi:prepilin-type processing-associated H-X9-DG protein
MLNPCERWTESLSAYLDGELTANETRAVEEHLQQCEHCRAWTELVRCDAQDTAAALLAHGASEGFLQRVMSTVCVTAPERPAGVSIAEAPAPIMEKMPGRPPKSSGSRVVEWLVVFGALTCLGLILFPTFSKSREKARHSSCMNNQRQLAVDILMHAQDHEEKLPEATDIWQTLNVDPNILICPTKGKKVKNAYGYNNAVSGKEIESFADPAETMLTFDAWEGKPDYRHNGRLVASYVDGHIEMVWDPDRSPSADTATTVTSESTKPKEPTIAPPTRNYGLADKLLIAYSATVGLQSENVQQAMERTELLFGRFDGFVLNSDFQRDVENGSTATVSGRVPSDKLGVLLVEIDKLGTLLSRKVNGEDLTGKHIENLEKLGDLHGTQDSLERIGGKARKLPDALTVEDRRGKAAGEASGVRLDEYRINSRTTLAEVTVTITSPPKPAPIVKEENPIARSLGGAWGGLQAFALWITTVLLIPLLIWLPVWGPVVGIVIWWWRRKKRAV